MENYLLKPNEVIIYQQVCSSIDTQTTSIMTSSSFEIILTNINLVIITKSKKLFSKEQVTVETIPIEEIKLFNNEPQIKQVDASVIIFFINGERKICFYSSRETRKFINKVYELLTGKNTTNRVADKVKGAVNLVDDTLGIKTVDTIKNIAENGVAGMVMGKFKKNSKQSSSTVTKVLDVANTFTNNTSTLNNPQKSVASINDNIETLKKLKELLDSGIISQEDYDSKKKELLNL